MAAQATGDISRRQEKRREIEKEEEKPTRPEQREKREISRR